MRRRLRGDRRRLLLPWAALTASIVVGTVASVAAAPGGLDRGFGTNGIGGEPLEPHFASTAFTAIAEETDGSLLATRDGLVRRFTRTGRLDPSFPPQRPAGEARLQAVQPDGKILEPGEVFRIKRLNPDGTLDPTFHGGESEETGIFGPDQIEVLSSGKILVAGTDVEPMLHGSTSSAVVVRLNPDGTVDRGFGDSGRVTLRTYTGQLGETVRGLVVQPDGGTIVVGQDFVARIAADGSVDAGFAAAAGALLGKVHISSQRPSGEGGVAVAGSTGTCCSEAEQDDFFVAHLGPGGTADPAYSGGTGIARIDGGVDRARTAMFASDGSVLIGGGSSTYTPGCALPFGCRRSLPVVARFDSAGNPDPAFGVAGLARIAPLAGVGGSASVETMTPRAGGGFVAGGTGAPYGTAAFLTALGPEGGLVREFGDAGVVVERSPQKSEQLGAPAMAVGPGGRIFAALSNSAGTIWGPSVIRYTRNGRVDRAFGGAGYVSWPRGDVTALAVDRTGGGSLLTEQPGEVVRFTSRGRISRRFNGGRPVALTGGQAHFHDVAIQPDGKVLVAGTDDWLDSGQMLVVRLLPNGKLDRRFGRNGYARVPCPRRAICKARRMALQRDGRILLAGVAQRLGGIGLYSEEPSRIALGRLLPDGRPDRSFGGDGLVALRVTAHSTATALALRGDRIVVAGWALARKGSLGVLARFRMDGRIDRRFGRRGVSRSFPRGHGIPVELFSGAGRLIAVMKEAAPHVLAFHPDGRPDRSYRRLPAERSMPGLVSGPGAVLQGGRVVLGWTRGVGKELIQLRLTRLAAR